MEFPVGTVKTEPCYNDYQQIPTGDPKTEIKSEVEVVEIDESIFLQGTSETSEKRNESNICNAIEDTIICDEIVKEEPVFYDPNEIVVLEEIPTNVNKKSKNVSYLELKVKKKSHLKKIYECYICRCETSNIGLLKWHLKERHPQKRQVAEQLLKKQQYSKGRLLLPKTNNRIKSKNDSAKKNLLKEKSLEKFKLKKNQLKNRGKVAVKSVKKRSVQDGSKERETSTQSLKNQEGTKCSHFCRKFSTPNHLENHQRDHSNQKPFQCPFCNKFYQNQVSFTLHKRIHTGEKPYSCNNCEMKFRLKAQLDLHIRAHINGLPLKEPRIREQVNIIKDIAPEEFLAFQLFECYLCRFSGPKIQVKLHIKEEHVGKKLWQCKICSKKLLEKYSFDNHMRIHTKNKFECHICGKQITRKDGLYTHLQSHAGASVECKYCHKKFSTVHILKAHIRTHTGLKPFECDFCKRGFVKRSDLVRHSRIHTGERPFKCDRCKMTFTRNHLLTDHKHNIHKVLSA